MEMFMFTNYETILKSSRGGMAPTQVKESFFRYQSDSSEESDWANCCLALTAALLCGRGEATVITGTEDEVEGDTTGTI